MPLLQDSLTPAEAVRQSIQQISRQQMEQDERAICTVLGLVWRNPDPQSIIDALGTSAASAFQASALRVSTLMQTSALLNAPEAHTALVARLQKVLALVKPTTTQEDGTVKIDPPTPVAS